MLFSFAVKMKQHVSVDCFSILVNAPPQWDTQNHSVKVCAFDLKRFSMIFE